MSPEVAIYLSSAGRRVELLNAFRSAGRELGLRLRVIAGDANPGWSAASHLADERVTVPPCASPEFVPAVLEVCRKHEVRLLVPTIDPELLPLARSKSEFDSIGTTVALSAPSIIEIARDKQRISNFFPKAGVATPRTASLADFLADASDWRMPVILKPLGGSASQGTIRAGSVAEVRSAAVDPRDYVVQEVWAGAEYTVNLFFDRGGLQCAVPHRRVEVRAGEVSKAVTERAPVLMRAAEKLGAAIRDEAFGSLCFQAIVRDDGEAAVFDFNARFGGGYPLVDQAGGKFARWLLEIALGRTPRYNPAWTEHLLMLRYDAAVFVEQPLPE